MAETRTWKTLSGQKIDFLDEIVKATVDGQRIIHVGCDSQNHGVKTEFVSVIVLLKPGKGGRVLWTSEKVERIDSLRRRLLDEAWRSVEIAMQVDAVVSEDVEISVHVDANPNTKFKSSCVVKEMVGMIVGQGFTALTKPDSFVAMHVADHIVKHKHERK